MYKRCKTNMKTNIKLTKKLFVFKKYENMFINQQIYILCIH